MPSGYSYADGETRYGPRCIKSSQQQTCFCYWLWKILYYFIVLLTGCGSYQKVSAAPAFQYASNRFEESSGNTLWNADYCLPVLRAFVGMQAAIASRAMTIATRKVMCRAKVNDWLWVAWALSFCVVAFCLPKDYNPINASWLCGNHLYVMKLPFSHSPSVIKPSQVMRTTRHHNGGRCDSYGNRYAACSSGMSKL